MAEEVDGTPSGRLRTGRVRVAGVTSVEVFGALRDLQAELNLPTMSQALDAALVQWLTARRSGVLHPADRFGQGEPRTAGDRVLQPSPAGEGGIPRSVHTDGLKELVRSRFPIDHPLRDAILAEKDILTPEELLSKLEVWATLLSRRA